MRRLTILVAVVAGFVAVDAVAVAAPSGRDPAVALSGGGVVVRVHESPFGLTIEHPATGTVLEELGPGGVPVRGSVTAPQPENPVGDSGGYGPLTFLVGERALVQWPTTSWVGNDLVAASGGAVYHPTAVRRNASKAGRHTLELATNAPGEPSATLHLAFPSDGQVEITFVPPEELDVVGVGDAFVSPTSERFHGFGARKDAVDQRGELRHVFIEEENWDSPDQGLKARGVEPPTHHVPYVGPEWTFPNGPGGAYYQQSLFVSSRDYAVDVAGSAPMQFDMASSREGMLRFQVLDDRLTYAVQFGSGMADVVERLTARTGRPPLPPAWIQEPWIDVLVTGANITDPAAAKQEVQETAAAIKEHDLPVTVFGVEPWEVIGDDMPALAEELRGMGFTLTAYYSVFVTPGSEQFEEGRKRDILVENAAGEPYLFLSPLGNPSGLFDFTHPDTEEFWREEIGRALDMGFSGFMLDFGEQVREDMRFHNGETGWTMHNAYPVGYARTTRAAVEDWAADNGGGPIFFYMRSGYDGSTIGTGGIFPGDETTDFGRGSGLASVIPAMLNLSVGGVPFFTTDIAGYSEHTGAASPELYVRWSQMAALSPIMRVHSAPTGNRHPWDYDEQTLALYRTYALLHRHLGGYLRDAARDATRTGLGIARPLTLLDVATPDAALDREYLLGDDLLVAPVLEPGATEWDVYLPAGERWQRLAVTADGRLDPVGLVHDGGRHLTVPADLPQIPVFLRAGADNPAPATGLPDASSGASMALTGDPDAGRSGTLPATGSGAVPVGLALAVLATGLGRTRRRPWHERD